MDTNLAGLDADEVLLASVIGEVLSSEGTVGWRFDGVGNEEGVDDVVFGVGDEDADAAGLLAVAGAVAEELAVAVVEGGAMDGGEGVLTMWAIEGRIGVEDGDDDSRSVNVKERPAGGDNGRWRDDGT